MAGDHRALTPDRRADVRLASYKKIDAVRVDRHEQPVSVLRQAEVVNVSAGGVMLIGDQPVHQGARIVVNLNEAGSFRRGGRWFSLESLDCEPRGDQKYQIRCKVVQGAVPAELIYRWS